MLHCDRCGVDVQGSREHCPLCQAALTGESDAPDDYPFIPDRKTGMYNLLMRLLVFLSIAAVVVCITINALIRSSYAWTYYVAGGVACMWFCLANVIRRRDNLPKNIVWMVFWISLLAVGWDFFTGWRQWAISYVVPSLCIFAMLAVVIIAKVLDMRIQEYMIYIILDALLGIVPALFLAFGWVNVRYPSIFCVAISVLSLAALFAFEGDGLLTEIKKRLHV